MKEKNQKSGSRVLILGHKCYRCGHEWKPTLKILPKVCPKCKSPYWDRPKNSEKQK